MQESKRHERNSSLLRDMNKQDQCCKGKNRPNDQTTKNRRKISKYKNLLEELKMENKIHELEINFNRFRIKNTKQKINFNKCRIKNTEQKIKELRNQVSDAREEPLQLEETTHRNEIALSKEADCLAPTLDETDVTAVPDSLQCNDELDKSRNNDSELSDKVFAFHSSEFGSADKFSMICSPNPLKMPLSTCSDTNSFKFDCIAPTTFLNERHSLSYPMQNSQRQVAKCRPETDPTSTNTFLSENGDPRILPTQSGNQVQNTGGTDERDKKSSWNALEVQPFNVFVDAINSLFKQGNPILMGPHKLEWRNEHRGKMKMKRSAPSKQVSAWKAESVLETKMDVQIKAQPGSCLVLPSPNTAPFRVIGTPVETEQDHLSSTNTFICSHCGLSAKATSITSTTFMAPSASRLQCSTLHALDSTSSSLQLIGFDSIPVELAKAEKPKQASYQEKDTRIDFCFDSSCNHDQTPRQKEEDWRIFEPGAQVQIKDKTSVAPSTFALQSTRARVVNETKHLLLPTHTGCKSDSMCLPKDLEHPGYKEIHYSFNSSQTASSQKAEEDYVDGKNQIDMMEQIFQRHDHPVTTQNNDDLISFTSSSGTSKGFDDEMKAYDNRHTEAQCSGFFIEKVRLSSLSHKTSLLCDENDLKREHEDCSLQKDTATVDSGRTLLPNKPNLKPLEESKNSEKKSACSLGKSIPKRNKAKKKRIKKKSRKVCREKSPKKELVERRLSCNSSSEASVKQERPTVRKRSRPNTDSTSLSIFYANNQRPSSAASYASSSDSGIGLSFYNVNERSNTSPIRVLSYKYVLTRNQVKVARVRMRTSNCRNLKKKSDKQLQHSFKYKTRIKQKTLITEGVKQYFKTFLTVKAFVRELHIDHRTIEVFGLGSYFDRLHRGDQLSDRERMQYEWLRLASFQHYTGNGNALSLARNGFYHDPTDGPTSTRCYLCDARHSTWEYFDNIEAEHRIQSPDCRFHVNRSEESTNVSISYENSGQELRGPYGSSTRHNTSRSSPTVLPFSGVSNPRVSSYCRYSGVLFSVRMNMHDNSTIDMSVREALRSRSEPRRRGRVAGEHGAFPLSEPSLPVRSTPSKRALGLQMRDTPSCSPRISSDTNTLYSSRSLVSPPEVRSGSQQRTVNLGPNEHHLAFNQQGMTGTNNLTNDRQSTGQVVTNGTSSLGPTQPSRSGRGRTESVTSVVIENPKYPDYQERDVRISSFQRWPEYLTQTPSLMAKAGFFFLGEADCTRCFCCGGGLKNWEPCDDPIFEHTRWFPRCEYVNKLKGEEYVAAVQRRHQQQMAEQQRQQLEVAQRTDVTASKKEENKAHQEMQRCKICNERPVNTALVPCGHLVTCEICATQLSQCPICQKVIRGTLKIYTS